MMKIEMRGRVIYIHQRDELTGIEFFTTINKTEFEMCVEKHKELGSSDPVKFTIFDYILLGRCIRPITFSDRLKRFLEKTLKHKKDSIVHEVTYND